MGKNQHVVPHANGWAVRGAGNARATTVHQTQAEAISQARGIAQNQQSELLIHGRNGQIRERDSFGKPSTHVRVLSGLDSPALASAAPEELKALLGAVAVQLDPPPPAAPGTLTVSLTS